MGIKYIVQGAVCQCSYGSSTDKLVVKTQSKVYLNDLENANKLAVTTTDTGATFERNCFGNCSKKNNNPCTATITQWSGEEIQKIEGAGNLLTEKSKATCPVGSKDCISIVHHGQQAEVSKQNADNADKEVHSQINPFVDLDTLGQEEKEKLELKIT